MIFLARRFDGKVTSGMVTMMGRVCATAQMLHVAPEAMEELEELRDAVSAKAFPHGKKRQLTEKNRSLLNRLDDQHFCDLVITLPQQITAWAERQTKSRLAPIRARTALAIELLLTCSMRRQNLCDLELGKSIKRVGQAPGHRWIIHLEPNEVKNGEELRFHLNASTATLLERYLEKWRPKSSSNWLFPGKSGGPIDPRTMAENIRSASSWILGIPITPHQFRHISADLYLREHPDKLSNITQHLGHRDPNTARWFYARSKQVEASQAYQEAILGLKQQALDKPSRKQARRTLRGNPND